jgi:CDP-diacylglycerol---glycerol-3-phosphate 3-phosphatidyltransferase
MEHGAGQLLTDGKLIKPAKNLYPMHFKLNTPNSITILRVVLIPIFVIAFYSGIPYKNLLSAAIFLAISFSDMLDGHLARKLKQVTEFGKLIDPIADKLLISTVLIILVGKGVDLWMAAVIIAREIILTAVRLCLLHDHPVIPASFLGKSKTFVQTFAIAFAILGMAFAWHVMLAAVILTIVSGLEYIVQIKRLTGSKIVNVPNLITLGRFLLIMPFVHYLLSDKLEISLLLFAVITISDKLDGISARMMNQKTEIGSWFDSFTDYTLITFSAIILSYNGHLHKFWIFWFLSSGICIYILKFLGYRKLRTVPVSFIARLNVLMIYLIIIVTMLNANFSLFGGILSMLKSLVILTSTTTIGVYVYKAAQVYGKKP